MTRKTLALALALAVALLAGCAHPYGYRYGPKAQVGALGGAASGGLIAAAASGRPEAVVAGVLLGGLLGGAIGDALDQRDRAFAARTAQYGLEFTPSGTPSHWRNPDSGHEGSFTPTRTYQTARGTYCREYQTEVVIDGWPERAYGTACRQPDGSWQIVP